MYTNFWTKQTTLTFLAQTCPEKKLGFEIQKINVGIRISILEIPCVPIFRHKGQLWIFGPKVAQKWILGSGFQKSKSGFGMNTSNIPFLSIFSQHFLAQIWGNCPITCNILVKILLRVSQRDGWRLNDPRFFFAKRATGLFHPLSNSIIWNSKAVTLLWRCLWHFWTLRS